MELFDISLKMVFFGLAMVILLSLIWKDSRGIVPGTISWIASTVLFSLSVFTLILPKYNYILSVSAFCSFTSWWLHVDGFLRYYRIPLRIKWRLCIPFCFCFALFDFILMQYDADLRLLAVNGYFLVALIILTIVIVLRGKSTPARIFFKALWVPVVCALNGVVRFVQAILYYRSDYWFFGGKGQLFFLTAMFVQLIVVELIQLRLVNKYFVHRMQEMNETFCKAQKGILRTLISYSDNNSTEAFNHVSRVGVLSEKLALALGWERERARMLNDAAQLHDIGKISIPDAILEKRGALDEREFSLMKDHSRRGQELLAHYEIPVYQMAAKIALEHHEHWDGTGYPAGLQRDSISAESRIVALCDTIDALSRKRCYKEAWPDSDIVAYLTQERGKKFDPEIVDAAVREALWEK